MPDPFSFNIKTCHDCTRAHHATKTAHANCPHDGLPIVGHAVECDCPIDRFRAKYPRALPPEQIIPFVGNAPDDLPANWATRPNVQAAYRIACDKFIGSIPPYPSGAYAGRGIVICGGGPYFLMAVTVVKLLRHLGCTLPVELWGLSGELPRWQAEMVAPLEMTCRRLDEEIGPGKPFIGKPNPGWELKTFAALHTRFAESLHLDADSFPQQDPTPLFDNPDYLRTGAIFWPDLPGDPSGYGNDLAPELWAMMGLPDRREPDFESGQFVVNREKWWHPLHLSNWLCRHGGEFYFSHIAGRSKPGWTWYGDKTCPHVAARVLGAEYAIPDHRPLGTHAADGSRVPMLLQRDFTGNVLFAHGTQRKWWSNATEPTSYAPIVPLDDIAAKLFLESRAEFFAKMPPPFVCAVTVAVGYADYIEATKANRQYLDDWLIVTVPDDPVIELCEREGIAYVADTVWLHKNGAVFNLGAGRNLGFAEAKRRHAGKDNLWLLALDGDCQLDDVFRPTLVWRELERHRLYGASRFGDGSEKEDHDVSGFFQLFHPSHFPARSYREDKPDCGQTDIWYRDQWKGRERTVLPIALRHLGTTGVDWRGRVSPPVGSAETKEENGRRLWSVIHGRPAVADLVNEMKFINWIASQIACPECRESFRTRLRAHPPRLYDRESYARWGWETHESVSADLDKPRFGWEAASARQNWPASLYGEAKPATGPVKILGLQRTGTNLAAYLASRNFGVTFLADEETGWKHGKYLPGPWSADARFILCARHPLANLLGFWRFLNRDHAIDASKPPQYRPGMGFEEFLSTPCYEFANPVDRWNRMYAHWLDTLPNERTALVRLEDQSDQSWVVGYVGRKLGLTASPLVTTNDRIDVGAESRGPFAPTDLSEYTPRLAYSIETRIDRKVMSRLGYGFRTSAVGTDAAPAKCGRCGK